MESLTKLPYGLAGQVYRSPMPYSRMFDPDWKVMPAYRKAGVNVVVVLTSWEEALLKAGLNLKQKYAEEGMAVIYLPTPDFGTPDPEPFREALAQALEAANQGKTVAIHCHAGLGRAGIFAACMAKAVFNLDGLQAFEWVRGAITGAVENDEQINFIKNFEISEG